MEKQRRLLGDDHPDTITSASLLAELLHEDGRYDESESLHLQAIESVERAHAGEALVGTCFARYAGLLSAKERWDEAEIRLLEAYEIVHSSVGPQAKSTREIAQALVELYEQLADQTSESRDDAKIETWRRAAKGKTPESLVTK